jgi:hypothetical protein
MARKKSVRDILKQLNRMDAKLVSGVVAARDSGNSLEYARLQSRRQKVYDTARRYANNIRNSKSYQNTANYNKWSVDNEARAMHRKYSQRTYMGNAIG